MPRPDTETVVERALEILRAEGAHTRALRIADLGTGSGAILLALLSELPNAKGIGTDISADALATAEANAAQLGLADRAGFIRCDYAIGAVGAVRSHRVEPALYPNQRTSPVSPSKCASTIHISRSMAERTGLPPIAR